MTAHQTGRDSPDSLRLTPITAFAESLSLSGRTFVRAGRCLFWLQRGGVGARKKSEVQPHALAYAPGVAVLGQIEAERVTVPAPAVRRSSVCRMHGAAGGAPRGNRNALKYGLYMAEAVETRCMVAALTKQARELVETV
jgi:hypothetical protein